MTDINQMRICDCWLDCGGCLCKINMTNNEGKRTNTNEEPNKKLDGNKSSNTRANAESKRPLDWDARDLKIDGRIPKSGRSTQGEYTQRFWEEE